MSTTLERKLHTFQQLYHIHMVVIPFFYSSKPTQTLAIQGIATSFFANYDVQMMQKCYFKNNKPIITLIVRFQSIEKAEQCRNDIIKFTQSSNKKKSTCEYCKDITQYAGILFHPGIQPVIFPQTKQQKQLIDLIAQTTVMNGFETEQRLKTLNQPLMVFLDERTLNLEHLYYRWRVYSYLQGDGDKKYRQQGFNITENGPLWCPPFPTQQVSNYPSILNPKQLKYLEECLLRMERRKFAIEEVMIFAIHNIAQAVHISTIIIVHLYEKLKQGDFIGIFYFISDILFNSTNHIYRDLFQAQLPQFVYRYVLLKQNDESKTMNDKFLQELKKLFSIWEKKFVFDENFMKGLIFLLELTNIKKLYQLNDYQQHSKIRQIYGGDLPLYELQKNCMQNGLPFEKHKQEEAKLFLNALFWQNEKLIDVEPDAGKWDGELISDKEILKIQSKGIRVTTCQNLPLPMLYEKNWKSFTSKSSLSQDGA